METNPHLNGWRIGRELSLPGAAGLAIQTGFFIWWLATLSSTVTGLVTANAKLEAEVNALSSTVVVPTALSAARIETVSARVFILESQMRDLAADLAKVKNEQERRTQYIPRKPQ